MMTQNDPESLIYHQIIARTTDFFYAATKDLLELLGCVGKAVDGMQAGRM